MGSTVKPEEAVRGFTSEKILSCLPAFSCTDMAHPGVKLKHLDWRDPALKNETSLLSRKRSFMTETLNKSVKCPVAPGQSSQLRTEMKSRVLKKQIR